MSRAEFLEHAARRVADAGGHVGSVMLAKCGGRIDFGAVARELGCDRDQVVLLALCWLPRLEQHAEDVSRVAQEFGIEPARLDAYLSGATS